MRLGHLALPVRDQARSRRFYEEFFGFAAGPAQRYPDGVLMLRDADGFDLALGPPGAPDPALVAEGFFHFGFRVDTPERAREVRARLTGAGVAVVEEVDTPELVSAKCRDPDGYTVEVYWEAPPPA